MLLALIIVTTLGGGLRASQPDCSWVDDQGTPYNLKPLDRADAWQLKDTDSGMGMFSMIYVFNFCDFSNVKCHDRQVGVYEALAVSHQLISEW